jgi:hypothetical protein
MLASSMLAGTMRTGSCVENGLIGNQAKQQASLWSPGAGEHATLTTWAAVNFLLLQCHSTVGCYV